MWITLLQLSYSCDNSCRNCIMTEDFVDSVLRCGLYLGAIFQLICIAAAIVMPDKMGDSNSSYCKVMLACMCFQIICEIHLSYAVGTRGSFPTGSGCSPLSHAQGRVVWLYPVWLILMAYAALDIGPSVFYSAESKWNIGTMILRQVSNLWKWEE